MKSQCRNRYCASLSECTRDGLTTEQSRIFYSHRRKQTSTTPKSSICDRIMTFGEVFILGLFNRWHQSLSEGQNSGPDCIYLSLSAKFPVVSLAPGYRQLQVAAKRNAGILLSMQVSFNVSGPCSKMSFKHLYVIYTTFHKNFTIVFICFRLLIQNMCDQ